MASSPATLPPAATSSRTTTRFFRPELDLLRLLAFSLVYVDHLVPYDAAPAIRTLKGGVFGVPLFFALSGYLITELLWREKTATGAIRLRAFYIRRMLRIWPLYFAALFTVVFLSRLLPGATPVGLRELAAYLLLSGNWYTVFHTWLPLGFGVLWSLGVEEQFYLIWPALVRALGRRAVLAACAAVWLISQVSVALVCRHAARENAVWSSTLSQMQYFALGAAISLVLSGRAPRFRGLTRAALILAGLALYFLNHSLTSYTPYLLAGAGTVLLFLGFLGAPQGGKWLRLRYLGKISYGLYIFHLPLILLVEFSAAHLLGSRRLFPHQLPACAFFIGLPLTILLAHLSYKYFEMPFLRWKERFEIVQSRPA